MPSPIDILITAAWRGGGATGAAQRELKNLGNTVSGTTVQFVAATQRARLLDSELNRLGQQVALGNLTTAAAQQKYNTFAASLANLGPVAKTQGLSLASLAGNIGKVTIAAGAATVAINTSYAALERGAGLELTEKRFNRLAESIGTTGDLLRNDLAIATRGLLSDAQQMALATDLVALGLANTDEKAVRLARIVTELDADIGELTLALANQTTKRFDQLGISVFGFQERLDRLKGTMSDEEAFTMAFLEQAEAQIERVGGKAGTAAGDLDELEASILNVRDAAAGALLDIVRFSGGLEDISEAADSLDVLADKIERVGDNFNRVLQGGSVVRFLTNPFGNITEFFDTVTGLQEELTEGLEEYLTLNEDYQGFLDKVVMTLERIEEITGIELIGNMERAIEEAESFDRVLIRTAETARELNYELSKIGDSSLPGRGGFGRGDATGNRSGERPLETFGTIQERINLFNDFQMDLSGITEREEERRAAITEQYESQRTEIVANYNRQRAREEEDWALRRARQEEDYRKSVDAARESAAEAERDARNDINERLEDLERDHLERMQDIIENANLQLQDAASRLDASAVARITREREKALKDERENYSDQRREIQEALDEQLAAIRENMEQRITDLEEFNAERQKREEEDRALRLARMQDDFRRQLDELKQQERDRLAQMKREFANQKQERTTQYIDERAQLTSHWRDKEQIEATYMERILEAEAEWWQSRLDLVGGKDGGTAGGGNEGGGTTGGGTRPSRTQLEQMAIGQMQAANWPDGVIFSQLRTIRGWSDAQLAKWIEDIFGFDVPGYRAGIDRVPRTGLAYLHEDEAVLNPAKAAQYRAGQMGNISPTYNIYPSAGMDEAALARKVKKVTEKTMTEFYERHAV